MDESLRSQHDLDKAVQAACESEDDIEKLRFMSMEERSKLLAAACRMAAAIESSKRKMGLPPSHPEPWPASTWELLKRHAPNAKR